MADCKLLLVLFLALAIVIVRWALTPTSQTIEQVVRARLPRVSNVGVAAIMGNIVVETGGTFDYRQMQHGGGPGYGLFQLDFMKPFYFEWIRSENIQDSVEAQIQWLYETVYGSKRDIIGRGNAAKIANALEGNDIEHAATVFCSLWERPGVPHLNRRIAAAKGILLQR